MKTWTLLPMAWLLVLGAPLASLAEMAAEETIETQVVEVAPDPSAVGHEATELEVSLHDEAIADATDQQVAAPVADTSPTAPAPLDPARPLPARKGTFEFGPLGVDSEGRSGRIHLVTRGDTLWDISDAYLGTPWVWPSVWNENNDIENPHLIVPGDRIWISSTEMRRVTDVEAEELMAAAQAVEAEEIVEEVVSEDDLIEAVPAALDEMPMTAPMAVTGPAPEPEELTVVWTESMGFISEDQYEAATSIVGSSSIRNWLGQGDPVYLGLGEGQVKVGDQFLIFEEVEAVRSLSTEMLLGYYINNLGWVEVVEVSDESSLAEIRESWSEIERGALLVPRPDPTVSVAVKPAARSIEGHVIFTPAHRTQMGTIDHVFLDIGTSDGLSVGSQLDVVDRAHKAYDSARGTKVEVPDHTYAQLVVVSTHPHSSVALVTHTRREVQVGQTVRGSSK